MEHEREQASRRRGAARPPSEAGTARVLAATLKEAFREARGLYGDDVRVLDSRTVVRRQERGLGEQRLVEVTVAAAGAAAAGDRAGRSAAPRGPAGGPAAAPGADPARLAERIAAEVERIEGLVADLEAREVTALGAGAGGHPLAAELLAGGAAPATVRRLAERHAAEVGAGGAGADPAAARRRALDHLAGQIATAGGDWGTMGGCHVVLGGPGAGKTDLVLSAAARLRRLGRRVLVLSLLPRHGGELRRLQEEAATHGYDAAVIQKGAQLSRLAEHIRRYEVVLVDTPALGGPLPAAFAELRAHLAADETCHRHLVVPLDADPAELERLRAAARDWSCDWLALSRLDRSERPAKLLDLLERLRLPVSLCRSGPWPGTEPELAAPARLAGLAAGGGAAVRGAAAGEA